MSKVYFVTTKFEDLSTGKITWGFRISDEYGSDFNDSFSEEEVRTMTTEDAIEIIRDDMCDDPDGFFWAIKTYGFNFNDVWIDAEDIKTD